MFSIISSSGEILFSLSLIIFFSFSLILIDLLIVPSYGWKILSFNSLICFWIFSSFSKIFSSSDILLVDISILFSVLSFFSFIELLFTFSFTINIFYKFFLALKMTKSVYFCLIFLDIIQTRIFFHFFLFSYFAILKNILLK